VSSRLGARVVRVPGLRRLARRWRADVRGAAAVQFIAVLPVFILLVFGMWSLFQLYSAQQTLCEAVNKAQRYLQVEGPWFPEDVVYPDGWVPYATEIINSELKSNAMTPMQVTPDQVQFFPPDQRRAPKDQSEVETSVPNAWFHLRATVAISGALGAIANLFDESHTGDVVVTCQSTGFYEEPPLKSTDNAKPAPPPNCPPVPPCTPGPPPPSPTHCVGPNCPTPDPCPPCE
jgi:hypothetical protein